jgi:hypothetical protein
LFAFQEFKTPVRRELPLPMALLVCWRRRVIDVGVGALVVVALTLTIHADGQNKDKDKDRDKDRDDAPRVRLPQLGPAQPVPACYDSLSGDWRVVHPWSSRKSPTAACRPPAPWDGVDVPAGGWGPVLCNAGGAFDCDANESFIQIDSIGPQGPQGPTGAAGIQGRVGPQGPVGPTGPQGAAGAKGEIGDKGDQGKKGDNGDKGDPGDKGGTGAQGPPGPIGPSGLGFTFRGEWDGATQYRENDVVTEDGSAYVARNDNVGVDPTLVGQVLGADWALMAAKGDVGPTGPQGEQGPQGLIGPVGPQGLIGPVGPQGGTGPEGPEGPAGARGAAGPAGPSGTTGQGAGSVVSTSSLLVATATLMDIPGLSLAANVTSATSAVVVSSDGGVQVNSNVAGQAVVVDIFLFVDGDTTPKQIVQRRIYAVNNAIVPNVANWSFSVAVSGLAPGAVHTFRVAAQLVSTNGSAAVVAAGGSSVLRGTLTVVAVNR